MATINGFERGNGTTDKYNYEALENKPTIPAVDDTLATTGAAADAKKTGDEIESLKSAISQGTGLTNEAKLALLACFEHVAWVDEDGQDYYDALEAALFPPANLTSISAVFTQGQNIIYDSDSLNTLKQYLVVTASYDDSSSETVTDYTLSGTLSTGTSTIMVTYGGKSATFTVTVTHATTQYTITNTLTHCMNSNSATAINEETAYSGTLTADTGYIIGTISVTMGNTDITSTAYDSSDGSISIASVTGNIVITAVANEDVGWISGVAYDLTFTQGKNISSDSGSVGDSSNYYAIEDYLPCHGVVAIKYATSGSIGGDHGRAFYNENYEFISGAKTFYTDVGESHIIVPDNAYYFRMSIPKAEYNAGGVSLTPYVYPTLTDETVWEAGTIYKANPSNGLMFCFGASQANILVDAGTYGVRGYYSLYDSAKQRTNSMGNTNNYTRSPITISDTTYYFSLAPGTTTYLVKLTASSEESA